jgi:hypothetical protein
VNSKKASRFSQLLARRKTAVSKTKETPEVTSDVVDIAKKPEAPKSGEQIKQNKVQQKRRLFNRRTGE